MDMREREKLAKTLKKKKRISRFSEGRKMSSRSRRI